VHPVMATGFASLLVLLALPACDDKHDQTAQSNSAVQAELVKEARLAAESSLRQSLNAAVEIGEVQSFQQTSPGSVAICGQVALVGSGQAAPFIAIVNRQPDGSLAIEQHVATERVSATRVFVESHARCVASAAGSQHQGAAPPRLPVVPASLATLQPAPPPSVARIEAEQQAVMGGATLRQPGNMRDHPRGGGNILRVVPRGTVLRVFAEAPGGWLQLGTDAPEGWVHASMLARGPAPAPEQSPTPPVTTASR
jgi:hypothetical protein